MKINNISGFVFLVPVAVVLMLGLSGMALAFKGDLKEDGCINWLDIDTFAGKWLNDCNSTNNWCDGADINHSNEADFGDFTFLVAYWRQIATPDPNLVGLWRLDESAGGSVSIDGSSATGVGDNTIQSNSPHDLINQTGSTVKAKFNYWDNTTVADVLNNDVDPLGKP